MEIFYFGPSASLKQGPKQRWSVRSYCTRKHGRSMHTNRKTFWCLTAGRVLLGWNKRASARPPQPSLPPHHHFIITVIIPEMCPPPKLCISIPGPSLAASCIFQKTLRLFNLNTVFLFFPRMFFLSSHPPPSFSSSTLPLSYKKWTVIVVMQDSYLYCSPQRPSLVEITCLKLRPIINPAVIFKWLLTSGSWNQKLYK